MLWVASFKILGPNSKIHKQDGPIAIDDSSGDLPMADMPHAFFRSTCGLSGAEHLLNYYHTMSNLNDCQGYCIATTVFLISYQYDLHTRRLVLCSDGRATGLPRNPPRTMSGFVLWVLSFSRKPMLQVELICTSTNQPHISVAVKNSQKKLAAIILYHPRSLSTAMRDGIRISYWHLRS
jgi:hypothetical protein